MLDGLMRPLLADPATREVIVHGAHAPEAAESIARASPCVRAAERGAPDLEGEVVMLLDADVLPTSRLATAHAQRQLSGAPLVALGYTPVRLLHERGPFDFAAHLRSAQYEARCGLYERHPSAILTRLWGGNLSLPAAAWLAIAGKGGPPSEGELGVRATEAGLEGVFDRTLHALRIYEPSLAEFVRDARLEGVSDRDRSPGSVLEAPASLALRTLVLAAGGAHLWRVQDVAARLLWAIERARGARSADSK
jgi:hypothetical protein